MLAASHPHALASEASESPGGMLAASHPHALASEASELQAGCSQPRHALASEASESPGGMLAASHPHALASEEGVRFALREADGVRARLREAGFLRGQDRAGRADEFGHAVAETIVRQPDVAGRVDGHALAVALKSAPGGAKSPAKPPPEVNSTRRCHFGPSPRRCRRCRWPRRTDRRS